MSVKNIAIIGAGPSGLAMAKYLEAEKAFDKIVIFEQRTVVGGLWYATPNASDEPGSQIPSVTPATVPDGPVWHPPSSLSALEAVYSAPVSPAGSDSDSVSSEGLAPVFISPIYESLETNIPRSLMTFSDHSFPTATQLFPKYQEVEAYLQGYAKDVLQYIRFATQVLDVSYNEHSTSDLGSWEVQSIDLTTRVESREHFDAVVVANGHYNTPFLPDIPGIQEWVDAFPGTIIHSKYYRKPAGYAGKKVLIVGNYASGLDIAQHILPYCKQPLLVSAKSDNKLAIALQGEITNYPVITSFDASSKTIQFKDGRCESDVDAVIFCTGYLYTLPFLNSLSPAPISDGSHVEHTYQHVFYIPRPTLTFLALPQKVIPFPIAEAQASIVARVYSGRLKLPPREEMERWDENTLASCAELSGRSVFHAFSYPNDADYNNMLWEWAASAPRRIGLMDGGVGKLAKKWTPWEYWCRKNFPLIRKAFSAQGVKRGKITTVEELGFVFEDDER